MWINLTIGRINNVFFRMILSLMYYVHLISLWWCRFFPDCYHLLWICLMLLSSLITFFSCDLLLHLSQPRLTHQVLFFRVAFCNLLLFVAPLLLSHIWKTLRILEFHLPAPIKPFQLLQSIMSFLCLLFHCCCCLCVDVDASSCWLLFTGGSKEN